MVGDTMGAGKVCLSARSGLTADALLTTPCYADIKTRSNFQQIQVWERFQDESALRLRVPHKVRRIVVEKKETKWERPDIPNTQPREVKKAIRDPHPAGLSSLREDPLSTDLVESGRRMTSSRQNGLDHFYLF